MASSRTLAAPSVREQGRGAAPGIGVREKRIAGSFRRITTHQLVLAWWLHQAGHITRRELRVWFAAHEMAERRRYAGKQRTPDYAIDELQALVGGRGSDTAAAELRADVRRLSKLGLVAITKHKISFATSVEQTAVEDISGFWSMFEQIPNSKRSVPVPRRTLRALAGGFSRAVTGVMIALLIRSLFWHREQGDYRVDGRTKLAWIADVFGISRRAVTDARAKLIELGWIEPVECSQWELNRWGVRDRIVTDWTPAADETGQGESASPNASIEGESASPESNSSLPYGNPKTRNSDRTPSAASDRSGVSLQKPLGSRGRKPGERRSRPSGQGSPPNIRDIQAYHLGDTDDLLELHRQAAAIGLAPAGEAGRLDFFSLAERARTRGRRPGALLTWLLREKRFDFITQADEDTAAARLREWRDGPPPAKTRGWGRGAVSQEPPPMSDEEKLVQACLRIGKQHRQDPFYLAQRIKGWSRERWDSAVAEHDQRQRERWSAIPEEDALEIRRRSV